MTQYGYWMVIGRAPSRGKTAYCFCRCVCGTERIVNLSNMRSGKSISCGCSFSPNMVGQTVGRLTVLSEVPSPNAARRYLCRCVCGNEKTIDGRELRRGQDRGPQVSCGCLIREVIGARYRGKGGSGHPGFRHGYSHADSPTYRSWTSSLTRCYNESRAAFKNYGAQGIQVCDRWNPAKGGSFQNFLADMGERPANTSLGRFGDIGNYEPGNCAWQTDAEQGAEKRKKHLLKIAARAAKTAEAA